MTEYQIECIDPGSGRSYKFTVHAESLDAATNAARVAGHTLALSWAQREEVDAQIREVRARLDPHIRQRDLETRTHLHEERQNVGSSGPPDAESQVEPNAREVSHSESTAGRSLLVILVAVVVVVVTVIFVGYIIYRVAQFHYTGK